MAGDNNEDAKNVSLGCNLYELKNKFLRMPNVAAVEEVRGRVTIFVHDIHARSDDARILATKHNIPIRPKSDKQNVIL